MLEHHPDILADMIDIGPSVQDILSIHCNLSAGSHLQPVQTSEKCRLAGSRRTDHDNDLPLVNID